MLHIMLLLLKIIGIVLVVILGILVLLLCIVLFVPVSYYGSAKCNGTAESLCGILKISWLFRLIKVNAKYENGNLKYSVQIAWKKLSGGKKNESNKEKTEAFDEFEVPEFESEPVPKSTQVDKKPENSRDSIEEKAQERSILPKKTEDETISQEMQKNSHEEYFSAKAEKKSLLDKVRNIFVNLKQNVNTISNKIKCTIKNLYDKLKVVLEKKDRILSFLQDDNHMKAFTKLKKEAFKLLKRLRPKEFVLKGEFGFEDPSLTGRILALLSIIYPLAEDHMEVVPVFDQKVLKGQMMIKGRIYIISFVCTAWNLVWNKHIRMLYKDIRNFKL